MVAYLPPLVAFHPFHSNWLVGWSVGWLGNFILNFFSLTLFRIHLIDSFNFLFHKILSHCTVLNSKPIKCSLRPNSYVIYNFTHKWRKSERECERVQECVSQTPVWMLHFVDFISFYSVYMDLYFVLFYLSRCLFFICLFFLFVYLPHIRTICGICVNSLSPWI